MAIDNNTLLDAVHEFIGSEGKCILTVGWDGGLPGMSGCMWVSEWHGLYFVFSSDVEKDGPFTSVDEALECEQFTVTTVEPDISSKILHMKALKRIALRLVADGDTVWINNKEFVRLGDKIQKQSETEYLRQTG